MEEPTAEWASKNETASPLGYGSQEEGRWQMQNASSMGGRYICLDSKRERVVLLKAFVPLIDAT